MAPSELRAAILRLCLTESGSARVLGVQPRTMRRWLAGEREIPEMAERMLFLFHRIPEAIRMLDDFPRVPSAKTPATKPE